MPGRFRVVVLCDNRAARAGFRAEHGLSILVERGGARVLFDTGQGVALMENAARLGVDLAMVDGVVLSHGHYDHTGGLAALLERNRRALVYLHPAAAQPKFARNAAPPHRRIGMPGAALEALERAGGRVCWTREAAEAAPGVLATGEIPWPRPLAPDRSRFFLDADCRAPDPFEDEQALVLDTERGLAVLTGCGHAGLPATLARCMALRPGRPVFAVFGGLHLGDASAEVLEAAAASLERCGAALIGACHCTGEAGREFLRARLGGASSRLRPALHGSCREADRG